MSLALRTDFNSESVATKTMGWEKQVLKWREHCVIIMDSETQNLTGIRLCGTWLVTFLGMVKTKFAPAPNFPNTSMSP